VGHSTTASKHLNQYPANDRDTSGCGQTGSQNQNPFVEIQHHCHCVQNTNFLHHVTSSIYIYNKFLNHVYVVGNNQTKSKLATGNKKQKFALNFIHSSHLVSWYYHFFFPYVKESKNVFGHFK